MNQNYRLLSLAIIFLLAGCATPTDLHVMTDDMLHTLDNTAGDEPQMVIYDEAAYNKNNDNAEATLPSQLSSTQYQVRGQRWAVIIGISRYNDIY